MENNKQEKNINIIIDIHKKPIFKAKSKINELKSKYRSKYCYNLIKIKYLIILVLIIYVWKYMCKCSNSFLNDTLISFNLSLVNSLFIYLLP